MIWKWDSRVVIADTQLFKMCKISFLSLNMPVKYFVAAPMLRLFAQYEISDLGPNTFFSLRLQGLRQSQWLPQSQTDLHPMVSHVANYMLQGNLSSAETLYWKKKKKNQRTHINEAPKCS